jgi:hypothetical protein
MESPSASRLLSRTFSRPELFDPPGEHMDDAFRQGRRRYDRLAGPRRAAEMTDGRPHETRTYRSIAKELGMAAGAARNRRWQTETSRLHHPDCAIAPRSLAPTLPAPSGDDRCRSGPRGLACVALNTAS